MDKIENTKIAEGTLSRRKALGRIGIFAAAAYTVPAFTTLSIARASDGSSAPSDGGTNSKPSTTNSSASDVNSESEPSTSSGASDVSSDSVASDGSSPSAQSTPSDPSPSDVSEKCGEIGDDGYELCLSANGWK